MTFKRKRSTIENNKATITRSLGGKERGNHERNYTKPNRSRTRHFERSHRKLRSQDG
uniref:Uncharacterized protein n=1 Tax=Siphoviridae sp. ct1SN28 TaxID=2825308 RepID=A0A8S5TRK8_9CAUD|nr:MAG TPA: hypothetical protein [Siphoviridae sp. ct1SN28]